MVKWHVKIFSTTNKVSNNLKYDNFIRICYKQIIYKDKHDMTLWKIL